MLLYFTRTVHPRKSPIPYGWPDGRTIQQIEWHRHYLLADEEHSGFSDETSAAVEAWFTIMGGSGVSLASPNGNIPFLMRMLTQRPYQSKSNCAAMRSLLIAAGADPLLRAYCTVGDLDR